MSAFCRVRYAPIAAAAILIIASFLACSNTDCKPEPTSPLANESVLIPAGEFVMGIADDNADNPPHKVVIDSFYIDKYEVTNARYLQFCTETDRKPPEFWGMDEFHCGETFPNHPVVGVSWSGARAFAEWAGQRLPTEAEWEYAARGALEGMKYPHGDEVDSTLANYSIKGVGKGTIPVGSYPPNAYGLHDMMGNVVEWVADWYDKDYYNNSPERNPPGPDDGRFKVIRGGGWHSGPYCCRVCFRNALPGNWVDFNVGFRCAQDLHPAEADSAQYPLLPDIKARGGRVGAPPFGIVLGLSATPSGVTRSAHAPFAPTGNPPVAASLKRVNLFHTCGRISPPRSLCPCRPFPTG
ncbi:MAG: formylglycine-generating enzyme family protein [candidate division Zixibacteria bacterium]|nr:formylglycine-generating enzyme family protein [candidate division Zixibacteria bacterium]